jgi:hypothetical protein
MTATPLSNDERRQVDLLLRRWLERARVALAAYNDATTRTIAAERRLGIPAVLMTALVGTGVFATLQEDPALPWRIATGILAVLAALLTALQTFLRQAERAEQYREAARSYSRFRRRIERAQLFPPDTREETQALLDELSEELAAAARGKPNLPQRIWDRADYKVRGTSDARGPRALWLRVRDALDFGLSERDVRRVEEDHARYFSGLDTAETVPISDLRPSREARSQPASVATARRRMHEAAAGMRERRPPLDVRETDDGGYVIVDGNATFAVAAEDGWETVPVRVLGRS